MPRNSPSGPEELIDRLCWLCEEAGKRAAEEPSKDFTEGLSSLRFEMKQTCQRLHEMKLLRHSEGPFVIQDERPETNETEGRWETFAQIKSIIIADPFHSFFETMLWSNVWVDRSRNLVRQSWNPDLPQVRQKFIVAMRRWTDWLKSLKEEIGPSGRTASNASTENSGRPRNRKQLDVRQCKAILKRIAEGESVKKIRRESYAGFNYSTFLRQLERHFGVSGVRGLKTIAEELF